MELKVGQKLRVKEFNERPSHWISEMDSYKGKIVTVKELYNNKIFINEDLGWYWKESDFQIVFDTWEDVRNIIARKCWKTYNCEKCPLDYIKNGICYDIYFNEENHEESAKCFEKMFEMECYVLEDEEMEKEFGKSSLKDGMVVEYEDGERRMIQGKYIKGFNGYNLLSYYDENLMYTDKSSIFNTLNIVKVYDDRNEPYTLKGVLENPKNLIWERKKTEIIKDISLEEINALLKEKYPDVEKFNLPIDKDR